MLIQWAHSPQPHQRTAPAASWHQLAAAAAQEEAHAMNEDTQMMHYGAEASAPVVPLDHALGGSSIGASRSKRKRIDLDAFPPSAHSSSSAFAASAHVSAVAGTSAAPAFPHHGAAAEDERRRKATRYEQPRELILEANGQPSFRDETEPTSAAAAAMLRRVHNKRMGDPIAGVHEDARPSKRVHTTDEEASEAASDADAHGSGGSGSVHAMNKLLGDLHQQRIERRRQQEWMDALREVEEASENSGGASQHGGSSSGSTFTSPPRLRQLTNSSRHFDPLPPPASATGRHRSTEAPLPSFVFRGAPAAPTRVASVASAASASSSASSMMSSASPLSRGPWIGSAALPRSPSTAMHDTADGSPPPSSSSLRLAAPRPSPSVTSAYRLPMSPLARFQSSPRAPKPVTSPIPSAAAAAAAAAAGAFPRLSFLSAHVPWWEQEQARRDAAAADGRATTAAAEGKETPHSSSGFHQPMLASAASSSAPASSPHAAISAWPFGDDSWAASSPTAHSMGHFFTADNRPFETMPWEAATTAPAATSADVEEEKRSEEAAAHTLQRSTSDQMVD